MRKHTESKSLSSHLLWEMVVHLTHTNTGLTQSGRQAFILTFTPIVNLEPLVNLTSISLDSAPCSCEAAVLKYSVLFEAVL